MLVAASLLLGVVAAAAQTIIGSSSTDAYAVSAADLIQSTGLSSVQDLITVDVTDNNAYSQGTTASLTDGTFGPAGASKGLCIAGGFVVYLLNTDLNPDGYTITNITTYSGWTDASHAQQNYTVSFLQAGSGNFVDPITVTYTADNLSPADTRVIVSGLTETNVTAILFDFDTPGQQNGGVGYKELDVFGYGAAPVGIPTTVTGSSSTSAYAVSATDLLQTTGLSSMSDALTVNAGENNAWSHGTTANLTDGTFGDAGANGGYCIAGGTVTYNLNTNLNPGGYTITNIMTYSGWGNGGRANQKYTVSFLQVGSSTFVDPIVVSYAYSGGGPSDTQVTIGLNETSVAAILFDFGTGVQENGGVGYKELDVLGYGAVPVQPLPTVTGSSSTSAYVVSTNDLLQTIGLSSVSDALVPDVGDNNASSHGTTASLTDGTFGDAGANGGYCVASGTVTYNLNTNLNPSGYTITDITTYSGWNESSRVNQNYTVSFLQVGSSTFVDLIVVSYAYSGGNPANTQVTVSGFSETNVAAIRFDFTTPAQQNSGVGYKEVDVFGYGAVPVLIPATYYWDNNEAAAGFGTAAGTWASPTIGNSSQGWSTDGTGDTPPENATTTAYDLVNFGNGATGLAAGAITVSGLVTNGGMTFASGSGAITLSGGTIYFPATASITVDNTSNNISCVVAGGGATLTKAGAGKLALSGANTYSGSTTVSGGTLDVNNAHSLGASSSVGVSSGTTLSVRGGITITNPISIAGSGVSQPSGAFGALLSTGTNTLTGLVTLSSARLATADTNTLTFTGGITNGSTGSQTFVGTFAFNNKPINLGANGIGFAGDGASVPPVTGKTIHLNVAGNNWSDASLNFAGIVQLGVDNALPTNATVHFGWTTPDNSRSTLDLHGHKQTVATIEQNYPAIAATYVSITGGGTLTVNQSSASKSFGGIISDGATPTAFTKTGTGTLTLSNACTYSGATTVSNGVLKLMRPNVLSTNTSVYLFTAAPGSLNLAFTGTNQVAALYINGVAQPAGVYGNTTAPITSTSTGFLRVGAAVPAVPGKFSGISVSGTTLTLRATSGTPNGPWILLSSTNVTLPLIQWRTNSTGNYDGSGNFSTNLVNTATNKAEFFRLR